MITRRPIVVNRQTKNYLDTFGPARPGVSDVREAKQLLRGPQREQIEATISTDGALFAKRLRSPEAMEAFQAFFQKRRPDFSKF